MLSISKMSTPNQGNIGLKINETQQRKRKLDEFSHDDSSASKKLCKDSVDDKLSLVKNKKFNAYFEIISDTLFRNHREVVNSLRHVYRLGKERNEKKILLDDSKRELNIQKVNYEGSSKTLYRKIKLKRATREYNNIKVEFDKINCEFKVELKRGNKAIKNYNKLSLDYINQFPLYPHEELAGELDDDSDKEDNDSDASDGDDETNEEYDEDDQNDSDSSDDQNDDL
jgi:hypothetical protein